MAVNPRQAATVIVVRGGAEKLAVLLARRNPDARFMGGLWVFPGGALDPADGEGDAGHRAAAVRELAEEAGLTLSGPDGLVEFSRWITPRGLPIRFDTRFFLTAAPEGQEPRVDGSEMVAIGWYAPERALADLPLPFPTRKHLEQLATFASADELLAWAPGREIVPVEPDLRDVPLDLAPEA
jgi:8-oxo-dGTP pyrophosphatase MutT (NUDIX family)